MALKGDMDSLRKEIGALEQAMVRRGVRPFAIRILNDPEMGLEEFRLADEEWDGVSTIRIDSIGPPGTGKG
jgi:hypothetical protein